MGSAFLDPAGNPALLDQQLAELETFLVRTFPAWGRQQASALREQTAHGWLRPLLWQPAPGGPLGLAVVAPLSRGVEVHGAIFEPAGAATLHALLRDIELEHGAPAQLVTDVLPGLDADDQRESLGKLGYWHRAKVLMRRPGGGPLPARPTDPELRPLRSSDFGALVELYAKAYTKRPGEFWVAEVPDPAADGREYVHQFESSDPSGFSPALDPSASFVWEATGGLWGAIVIARSDGPSLVSNVMVHPDHQRQGIGQRLMAAALHALDADRSAVDLVAVREGGPYRLYRRLGFFEVPAPEGRRDGHWVHVSREPDPFRSPAR
jgi:ribosomal protein S18 acetylase RimI-like enzyme